MDANVMSYLERRQQQQSPSPQQQPPMVVGVVPPPPGVTPNFDNPELAYPLSTGKTMIGVGVSIAGLFIMMRIYTKARILRNFGAEDVSIILAFLCSVACCGLSLKGADYGTGRHIWEIPAQIFIPRWGQIVVAATVVYCPAMMFAKLAILICYLRISPQKSFHYAVYVAMFITVAYNLSLMLSLIFGCSPIAKAWDLRIQTGSCINRPAVYLSNAILNVATDFMILLLPVPMIRALKMPFRQKLLVAAMFSVGSLACIIGIVRLKTLIPTLHDPDQTWAIAVPGLWVVVEVNLAVACGCLSVIRPFLRHHFPFFLGETRRSRPYSSSYERYRKAKPSDYFSSTSSNPKHLPNSAQWAIGRHQNDISGGDHHRRHDSDGIPLDTQHPFNPTVGTGAAAGFGGTMGLGMAKTLEPEIYTGSDGGESGYGLGNKSYATSTNTRSSTPPPIYAHPPPPGGRDKQVPPLPPAAFTKPGAKERGSKESKERGSWEFGHGRNNPTPQPTPPGQVLQLQGLPEEELRGTMSEREMKALGRGGAMGDGRGVETVVTVGTGGGKKEGRRSDERGREREAGVRERRARGDTGPGDYEGREGILRTVDVGVDIESVGPPRR